MAKLLACVIELKESLGDEKVRGPLPTVPHLAERDQRHAVRYLLARYACRCVRYRSVSGSRMMAFLIRRNAPLAFFKRKWIAARVLRKLALVCSRSTAFVARARASLKYNS